MSKGKVHPRRPIGIVELYSTLSLTSALDGMGDQQYAPAVLPLGMTRYPLYRRLGRSRQVRKTSTSPGFDPRTVQHVANRYTD
jgi:hypothetical protein